MIQSICSNCGNSKDFEEVHLGRTYKCPNCGNPVTIQKIVDSQQENQLQAKDSVSIEIIKAAEEKEKKEKENQKRQEQEKMQRIEAEKLIQKRRELPQYKFFINAKAILIVISFILFIVAGQVGKNYVVILMIFTSILAYFFHVRARKFLEKNEITTTKNNIPSGDFTNTSSTSNANINKSENLSKIANDNTIHSNQSTSKETITQGTTTNLKVSGKENIKKSRSKVRYLIPIIAFSSLIILGSSFYFYLNYQNETKTANIEAVNNEHSRIEKFVIEVNNLIGQKRYDDALVLANNINWTYDPKNNGAFVSQYDLQRETTKQKILKLKENLGKTVNEIFPYNATAIAGKVFFYKSPQMESISRAYIISGQQVTVYQERDEFLYVSFMYNSKETKGWMRKGDLKKD